MGLPGAPGAAGAQGPQGSQGPRGGGVTWTDAEGATIPVIGSDFASVTSTTLIVPDQDGVFFRVNAATGDVTGAIAYASAVFDNATCTGLRYIPAGQRPLTNFSLTVQESMWAAGTYVVPAGAVPQTFPAFALNSFGPMGPECSAQGTLDVLPVTALSLPSGPLFAGPATATVN
jgi:hypothetical protein